MYVFGNTVDTGDMMIILSESHWVSFFLNSHPTDTGLFFVTVLRIHSHTVGQGNNRIS